MAYTIHPYSTNKKYTTKSVNDNISSIMSRMVQIAGRVCENYAGDIYYSLSGYYYAVHENCDYDKLLVFYDCGVGEYIIDNNIIKGTPRGIQYWRLTWNPKEHAGTLTRIYLRKETDD